jgi:capsular exopolysaccharide synthesis family protein
MEFERKKIPILNEKIDLYILWYIFKRSLIFSAFFYIVAIGTGLIYLRYTPPLYKASSIIQIKNENDKTNQILDISTAKEEVNLNQTIELLRSPEFLKRTFNKLPLYISYYSQGTFLAFELYRSSPFKVDYEVTNPAFYQIPIYVSFTDHTALIHYKTYNNSVERNIKINEWADFNGLKLKLSPLDTVAIREQTEKIKNDSYFFTINDSTYVQKQYSNQLEIFVLNNDANTIQISFTDKNPTKASEIAKTIAEEFISYDVENKIASSQKILAFIENQSKLIYHVIDSLEEQLIQFRYAHNITVGNEDEKSNPVSKFDQMADKTQEEIESIDIELYSYNNIISSLEKNPTMSVFELISILPSSNPIVMNIVSKIQQLDEQKEQLLASKTSNSFQIKTLNSQMENQKKTLIDLLKMTAQRLDEKKKLLSQKYNEYQTKEFGTNSLSDLDYLKLKRLYDINVGYYNKLLEKKAEYLINQAGSISQNIILQNALIPSEPISPSKKMIIIIFIVLATLLSIALIIIRYLLYNEITSATDVQSYTSAKILGIIPLYKSKLPISQLLIDIKPNSVFSESFRACRSSIDFLQKEKTQNIIAISSTISGEGKTFVSINLAGVFALQDKKVVLVDLDLRKPRIHLSFNTDNSKGVSTILIGKNSIDDCIKKSKIQHLDFITAGPIPPNPSELITNRNFDNFLAELSNRYDYVVVDTPPLGLVSDALTVFKKADFPIYVIKSHYSKRSFLYNINHLIDEKGISTLTVLINAFDYEKSKYSNYGYSYNYGYGYVSDTENHYYEDIPVKKHGILHRIFKKIGL